MSWPTALIREGKLISSINLPKKPNISLEETGPASEAIERLVRTYTFERRQCAAMFSPGRTAM
jgi:hypothetical protein